jgi:hypothetical protein
MSVNYTTTAKNNRLTAVVNLLDASSNALLVIGTSSLSGATGVLATVTLQKPSFTVSGGVMTLAGTPSATISNSGAAALAELRDSTGATVVSGLTVGTGGTDITVATTTFTSGVTVNVASGTITEP